ncbi:hypothetical protein GDO81_023765 [Engystomops pustulosus]|uniref:Uncharacterized protein n=1 Tax=Engystomops pustulosus TaxID=76066 RepID=A0AAV6ZI83_ENGPU|nr:hypothetical protein GDO81_023765 [Engystomops pustulosus]
MKIGTDRCNLSPTFQQTLQESLDHCVNMRDNSVSVYYVTSPICRLCLSRLEVYNPFIAGEWRQNCWDSPSPLTTRFLVFTLFLIQAKFAEKSLNIYVLASVSNFI